MLFKRQEEGAKEKDYKMSSPFRSPSLAGVEAGNGEVRPRHSRLSLDSQDTATSSAVYLASGSSGTFSEDEVITMRHNSGGDTSFPAVLSNNSNTNSPQYLRTSSLGGDSPQRSHSTAMSASGESCPIQAVLQTLESAGQATGCFVDGVVPPARVMSPCHRQRVICSRRDSVASSPGNSILHLPPRAIDMSQPPSPQADLISPRRTSRFSSGQQKVITTTQCPSQLAKPRVVRSESVDMM